MIVIAAILMAARAATPVDAQKAPGPPQGQAAATVAAESSPSTAGAQADADAQEKPKKEKKPTPPAVHEELVVTATRYELDSFQTPVPISVVSSDDLARQQPEKMVDVLKQLPGVDVFGEGRVRRRPPRLPAQGPRGQRDEGADRRPGPGTRIARPGPEPRSTDRERAWMR